MRYRRDKFSIESGEEKRRPYPEWFLDKPVLLPGEEWFLTAYWTCATERRSDGQTVGHIPWSSVIQFGSYHGLDRWMLDLLWAFLSEMDKGFLLWMKNEHDRHVRMNKPKKKPKAAKSKGKR
mgnify:CR=1 FL=1